MIEMMLTTTTAVAARAPATPPVRDPAGYCVNSDALALLNLINALRVAQRAPPLQVSQAFGAAAQYHVESMSAHRYFSHDVIPDGQSWWQIAQEFGATSADHGENIAWGNADAGSTFDQWTSDAIHYDNLVDPHYTVIGIGRVVGPPPDPAFRETTTIWAVTFGDRLDRVAPRCPDNATPAATNVALSDAPTPRPTSIPLSDAPATP
jgi:uncharacterized protein YkwD